MDTDKYTEEIITEIQVWAPNLFSFRTTRDRGFRFVAGQFARLGVEAAGEIVWRAYSIVSAPYDEFLEFYSIVVPGGAFTSQLAALRVGDRVLVERRSLGFLTTDRFELGRDLWMLSTGTGLAPFLSILYDLKTWETYENLVLVHKRPAPQRTGLRGGDPRVPPARSVFPVHDPARLCAGGDA